jgi:DNA-binding NarL/FixJ family response regulator
MAARTEPKAKIFIVDDHPLVREWLAGLLGHEPDLELCGQAEDVAGALAAIETLKPRIAIVDLSLRNDSGLDLIREMRDRFPKTSVIVLSMYEEIHYAERALRAGARGYVTKRESTARIVGAIREVLAGRVYASPEVMARLAERLVGRAPPPAQGPVATLSNRELEVFQRLGQGHTTRRIAADLGLSMKTVQAFSARIKVKFGLTSATELNREAVRWVEGSRKV